MMNIPLEKVGYPEKTLKFYKKEKQSKGKQGHKMTTILLNPDKTCVVKQSSLEWDPKAMVDWIIPVKGEETTFEGTYSFQVKDAIAKFHNRNAEAEKEEAKEDDMTPSFLKMGETQKILASELFTAEVELTAILVSFKMVSKHSSIRVNDDTTKKDEEVEINCEATIASKHKQMTFLFTEDNKLGIEQLKIAVEAGGQVMWCEPAESKKLCWNYQKKYVEEQKNGRLMTLEEVRAFIKHAHDDKAIYKGDWWVACTGKDGERDWVQIGTHHSLGKSHNDSWGYPGWGDDEDKHHGHRRAVLWMTIGEGEKKKKGKDAKKEEVEGEEQKQAEGEDAPEAKTEGGDEEGEVSLEKAKKGETTTDAKGKKASVDKLSTEGSQGASKAEVEAKA